MHTQLKRLCTEVLNTLSQVIISLFNLTDVNLLFQEKKDQDLKKGKIITMEKMLEQALAEENVSTFLHLIDDDDALGCCCVMPSKPTLVSQ